MMDYLLPIVGGSCILAGSSFAYIKLRPFFPVQVNCWFCNTDTKVPFKSKNSFVCPNCKQYNGFTEDGDYNCDMPSQYCESLNSPPTRARVKQPPSSTPGLSLGNGLCQTCNLYQAMKVKALADFVPSHPDKFDEEVDVYERRLERLYGGLCSHCNKTLSCALMEQDTWLKPKLLNWRMQQSTTLLKALLTPMHGRMSWPLRCITLLLRTLCFMLATSLLLFELSSIVHLSSDLTNDTSSQPKNHNVESLINSSDASVEQDAPLDLMSYVLTAGSDWGHSLRGHEAGAALLLLALQLAAVALAGKQHLRSCDAVACVMLALSLSVASWQQFTVLTELISTQQLVFLKVIVYGACVLAVAAGFYRPPAPLPPQFLRRTSSRCRVLDSSQDDSQLTENSMNTSQEVLGNPLVASPPPTSPASLTSSRLPASLHPTPLIAARVSTNNTFSPSIFSSQTHNPFLNIPAEKPLNYASLSCNPGTTLNQSSSLAQPKFALKPSALGDNLNTSLQGLSLGSGQNHDNSFASRNPVLGGGPNRSGMVLRSQQARLSHNTSSIAQASWVAGGYWGSPSKNKRSPVKQWQPPVNCPVIVNNVDPVPPSRPSSQSSGFVSHGSGSHASAEAHGAALNANAFKDTDRISVASEPTFTWNFEACETSSQSSQNTEFLSHASTNGTVRRRHAARLSSIPSYPLSDTHSMSSATVGPSIFSSAASGVMTPYQDWRTGSPADDMNTMRALSRLSQHDISDDNLSLISGKTLRVNNLDQQGGIIFTNGSATLRNPWIAFILGMSVMANGFLVLVLYKNGTLAELMR
ncbi:transmembrane protein 201-like isoform X2 [Hyalella azteca]|uniref:Transmembrane protein 201-like isoform X2 n=1 Tax=Hyalella azteca TaxID=294128 RepID=A0A979FPZ7_HYAAZ|nr:transmembrane protein 201-like isoform X2 [Hyalella azteca]